MHHHFPRARVPAAAMLAALILAGTSAPAGASVDGDIGDTSKGVFQVAIGNANCCCAKVRVFGLSDMHHAANATSIPSPWGNSVGVRDQFCVAHSQGGDVKLTLDSAGIDGGANEFLVAKSATSGAQLSYHMAMQQKGSGAWSIIRSTQKTFTVANAQTDMDHCVTPNVTKQVHVAGRDANTDWKSDFFSDAVTVTASPI